MILKLGMKQQAMELSKVCINHDPGMILTYFTARSTLFTNAFEWEKKSKMELNGGNLLGVCKWAENVCLWKKFDPRRLSAPALGLYTCI